MTEGVDVLLERIRNHTEEKYQGLVEKLLKRKEYLEEELRKMEIESQGGDSITPESAEGSTPHK